MRQKAEREGIIIKKTGKDIDHKPKPRAKESTRCYLTRNEVKKIQNSSATATFAQLRGQAQKPVLPYGLFYSVNK